MPDIYFCPKKLSAGFLAGFVRNKFLGQFFPSFQTLLAKSRPSAESWLVASIGSQKSGIPAYLVTYVFVCHSNVYAGPSIGQKINTYIPTYPSSVWCHCCPTSSPMIASIGGNTWPILTFSGFAESPSSSAAFIYERWAYWRMAWLSKWPAKVIIVKLEKY